MTRKDYQRVARVLADAKEAFAHVDEALALEAMRVWIAERFVSELKGENNAFKAMKFLDACKVNSHKGA